MKGTPFLTLILLAVLLVAAAAAFVAFNKPDGALAQGSFDRVAATIARGEDHVSVRDLSDRIIKERRDFMLIDVRSSEAFQDHHIRGAENIPLPRLLSDDTMSGLPRDRLVVLYGNGTTDAGQAAALLQLVGVEARSLLGGLNEWNRYMAGPEQVAGTADDDALQKARQRAVSCFFAGDYAAQAGIPVRRTASNGGGFEPPLEPAGAGAQEESVGESDPLGLGLGLGVEPGVEPQGEASAGKGEGQADPLGLGLGLGLDGDAGAGSKKRPGLQIGEGC